MANIFDQFDEPAGNTTGNIFDQFDVPETPKPEMPVREVRPNAPRAAAVGAGMGLTAGLAKYPLAAAAMIGDRFRNPTATNPLDWETAKTLVSQEVGQTAEANPVAYGAGNLAGAIVSPVGRVGNVVKGASVGAAAGRGALSGGVYGGLTGYSANEDLGEAAVGATGGTIVGGAIPVAGRFVQGAMDKTAGSAAFDKLRAAVEKNDVTAVRQILGVPPSKAGTSEARIAASNTRVMDHARSMLEHAKQTGNPYSVYGLPPRTFAEGVKEGAKDVTNAQNMLAAKAAVTRRAVEQAAQPLSRAQVLNPNSTLPGNIYGNVVGAPGSFAATAAGNVARGGVNFGTNLITAPAPKTLSEANQSLFDLMGIQ